MPGLLVNLAPPAYMNTTARSTARIQAKVLPMILDLLTSGRLEGGSPLPRERKYQRHQCSGEPCQNGYVQDKQIRHRRPGHHCSNLQGGSETEFWDQDPNSAADFQNAGEVAKPLPDSDLRKLLNH